MPSKGARYRVTLLSKAHKGLPRVRVIVRDSDADALESARRELRRVRRTDPAHLVYDVWTVWKLVTPGHPGVLLGEGTITDDRSTVESRSRDSHRAGLGERRNPVGPFQPDGPHTPDR